MQAEDLPPRQVLSTFSGPATAEINVAGKERKNLMNPLIRLKTTPTLLIALALFGFALLPGTHRSNGFAEGAFCAGVEAQRKATAIVSAVRVIDRRSYHFGIAEWSTKSC
jgi:hypothetical protein